MDGATVQARIYAGYARMAGVIGRDYSVYRAASPLNPIAIGNKIATMPLALSATKDFAVPNKYLTPTFFGYADGRLLRQFDILVGPFGTLYVADMQPNLPLQVIKCNHTVSIGRAGYSTSGPITQTVVNYATGLPVFMQFRREDIKNNVSTSTLGQAITHWTAFIPLPVDTLKQDDVVLDEAGIRYVVDAPDFTEIGYAAHLRLAKI